MSSTQRGGRRSRTRALPILERKPNRAGKLAIWVDQQTAVDLQELMLREWPAEVVSVETLVKYLARREREA